MKTMKRQTTYKLAIFLIITALSVYSAVYGQPPMPPGDHGSNGNQGGGFAPIDGGLLEMMLGILGYGAIKLLRAKKIKQ
jgi:hypothetical protein